MGKEEEKENQRNKKNKTSRLKEERGDYAGPMKSGSKKVEASSGTDGPN